MVIARCVACKSASYCSKSHQKLAWHAGHKAECKAESKGVRREKAGAAQVLRYGGVFRELEIDIEDEEAPSSEEEEENEGGAGATSLKAEKRSPPSSADPAVELPASSDPVERAELMAMRQRDDSPLKWNS